MNYVVFVIIVVFFFKQKTAYEMRISDWSSDVCSSDLTGDTFGEIVLNLNWTQGTQKKGFFGGGSGNIDLDLGVLFEMQDGYKGVIQALGRSFGDFNQEPWISLSGDDRTCAVTGVETIRVNGRFFDRIKRIAVFALIYNWVDRKSTRLNYSHYFSSALTSPA